MKRFLAVLLCGIVALSVAACSGEATASPALTNDDVLAQFERIYGVSLTYTAAVDTESDKIALMINDDKTAVLNGEDAKWKVKTNDGGYLEIDSEGKDVYHLSVRTPENAQLAEAGSYALTDTETEALYIKDMAVPELEEIEITEDNWKDYLEIVPVLYKQADVFGDIEDIHYSHALRLNEKYKDAAVVTDANAWVSGDYKNGDIAQADIAVEIKLSDLTVKTISYDIKKDTYKLEDYKLEDGDSLVSDTSATVQAVLDAYDIAPDSESASFEGGWNNYYDLTFKNDGKKITRTEELYQKAEVKRIKGTIKFIKFETPQDETTDAE